MKQLRDLGNEYCVWDALMQISAEHPIHSYLEIGTRYGDSLLRVLAASKERLQRITIADIWHVSYFGANHNGTGFDQSHKHIERMLNGLGYGECVTFLDGDSAKTIPTLGKNELFDLVLVDGDHDLEPARADLFNVWPHVAPGGFLVFDDIQSAQHMSELWTYFTKNAPDVAESHIRINKKFGVGVAVRANTRLETSKIRKRILDRYPIFATANGIDIGCSRDPISRICVAFDESDWPEVTHRGDARALPFGNEEFDWVWSSHALEHFEDTQAVLKEWLRVLKPGGMIGIYVPDPSLYHQNSTEHKHPGFTPAQLSELLVNAGCEVVETFLDDEPIGPWPRYSALAIARKGPWEARKP